jgi:amino acid transporter
LSQAIFVGCFWILITALNFLPVKFYGEIEFYAALIKVITVLSFMIFAICIDAGAGQEAYLGFKYWHHPGSFAPYLVDGGQSAALAKFLAFWSVLIQAGFSYSGTELVAVAAGETYNPRKTIPSAIRKTFFRIILFFVFTIFFIGLLIPYDNEQLAIGGNDASASPLVIAAKLAGIKTLPGLINAVLLCTVLSAANSNVYSASRVLVGLASACICCWVHCNLWSARILECLVRRKRCIQLVDQHLWCCWIYCLGLYSGLPPCIYEDSRHAWNSSIHQSRADP